MAPQQYSSLYKSYDLLVIDEMQIQSGDAQLLSPCVLKTGGVLILSEDWHQTRTRPDVRFDHDGPHLFPIQ